MTSGRKIRLYCLLLLAGRVLAKPAARLRNHPRAQTIPDASPGTPTQNCPSRLRETSVPRVSKRREANLGPHFDLPLPTAACEGRGKVQTMQGLLTGSSRALMDDTTDPDTRVGLLQEQARNMRSKCRCSCVLQFTCRLAASCVLHRPPSQLIHCMALYLRISYRPTVGATRV